MIQASLPHSGINALAVPDFDIVRWVEANRLLDRRASSETGPKKIARTPFLRDLYKWFVDDNIKEIVIPKSAQIGVTDWAVDCILWVAVNDPSPMALFLADQETARKIMRFRLDPAFRALGLIKKKIAKNKQQDISKFEINLTNGFYLAVSWGSSISQTASMSFKRVICDEINKPGYDVVKEEGDTLDRIRERMETFGDSKFILLSTPTLDDGRVTEESKTCDAQFSYCVPCPLCGVEQALTFSRVVWEGGSKATREQVENSARYKCLHCEGLWTEDDRVQAISKGRAMRQDEDGSDAVETISYSLSRLVSLFKGGNLARVVWSFLRSKTDPLKLQNFVNSTLGEAWTPTISPGQDTMKAQVAACKSGYASLVLPPETVAIAAAVDVQQSGFWYVLRAVTRDNGRYSIDKGFLKTWDDLSEIIFDRNIEGFGIWRCLIDTGGGKDEGALISRTEETYTWIRENRGRGVQLWGCKGSSTSLPTKIKIGTPIEKTPSGKPIPGGLQIVSINTNACKDALWYRIDKTNREPESPGNWWIHRDTPDWYLDHLTAESKERNRKTNGIVWKQKRYDNHCLDCEVYLEAALDPEFFGGIRPLMNRRLSRPATQAPASTSNSAQGINTGFPGLQNNPAIRRY